MNEATPAPRRPRRGIYLLPNLFTTGALFSGFYAIIAAMGGHYGDAVLAVFVAAVLDGLDGRVARLTHTQSEFGVQYDSLSDLVSFGLAPSLILYSWSLSKLSAYGPVWGRIGWAAAFMYAACAALRLARFNTQVGMADKRYFQGLASPAAAAFTMIYLWAAQTLGWNGRTLVFVTPFVAAAAALLMVSRFRYFSFKSWPVGDRVPFIFLFVVVLVLVALAIDPPRVAFGVILLYVLSGPVLTLLGLAARQRQRRRGRAGTP
ncbi:CDP-alcohol phosphatidyltransferase family protein [Metallibacterium scheffleri]|uniref:CDP-diacylglycerol--serine O-phosphatidyltransferase n=2 Tax=root TaxID=1 RepID=A0A4S3KRK9_9GAMM|nr:CDP-alcohol phosphatidyltransferase family protein [Metallibacterium scheffleri]THD11735.1 CDP-diacylglycerol--serine O-phosphatidyltransferase [Metallibacterium scheffleri]